MDDGVPVFISMDELPHGIVIKWEGTTRYQIYAKGCLSQYMITVDRSGWNNGRIVFKVSKAMILMNKFLRRRAIKLVRYEVPVYFHTLPIVALSSGGYINILMSTQQLTPIDLYSTRVAVRVPARPFKQNMGASASMSEPKHDKYSDNVLNYETGWQNDSSNNQDGWSDDHSDSPDGPGEWYRDSDVSGLTSPETTSLIDGVDQSGTEDGSDSNASRDHEPAGGETSVFISDAYKWYGEPFNSPFDQEIGVVDGDGNFIRNSNEINDPIVEDYINDKYMDQYQQDVNDYESSDTDDDPYADWSESWDPWEL